MQLKYSRSNFSIAAIASVTILIVFLTVSEKQLEIAREDVIQNIVSKDLGFSHFRTLLDSGEGQRAYSSLEKVLGVISKIPDVIAYKIFGSTEFERLDLEIKFRDYSVLADDRLRALRDNILTDPTKVKALVRFRGEKMKARVRLKGDLHHHWDSEHRMSLRVELKNDASIFGFTSFSLQKPRERKHPYDYAFQSMVRDTGNLAATHEFAHVYVNGEDWGIMDLEEHMTTEFIEKQGKKDSLLFRFGNEEKWKYLFDAKNPHPGYKLSDSQMYVRPYNKKFVRSDQGRKIYSYITRMTLENNINLFDLDAFTNALIATLAWNNTHTIADSNSRYYFNPYSLKVEPVTADQGRWWTNDGSSHLELNDKYLQILSNDTFRERLPDRLEEVSEIVFRVDDYFSFNDLLFPVDKKKNTDFVKDQMHKILKNREGYVIYPITEEDLELRLNKELMTIRNVNGTFSPMTSSARPTYNEASEFEDHVHVQHSADGRITLRSLIPDSVELLDIVIDNDAVELGSELIVPSYLETPNSIEIETNYAGFFDEKVVVRTSYRGFERVSRNSITVLDSELKNPLLMETVQTFPFVNQSDLGAYEINKGEWDLRTPLIINGSLRIPAGTSLSLSKEAYIIVKGALFIDGTESEPVRLSAAADTWKGIYVFDAPVPSHLAHAEISDLAELEDGLLKLTGGLNFYRSDVTIENSMIQNIAGEDALNIIESNFLLRSLIVEDSFSDGFDSDFSYGRVVDSTFTNIGGDALDFSGSIVTISDSLASRVRDKAVSAGERSDIRVEGSNFTEVGVAVASKDVSSLHVENTKVSNYKLHAAMTYRKKSFYEMPQLEISNSDFMASSNPLYMRENETSLLVDGVSIQEQALDVKEMYKSEVMSK